MKKIIMLVGGILLVLIILAFFFQSPRGDVYPESDRSSIEAPDVDGTTGIISKSSKVLMEEGVVTGVTTGKPAPTAPDEGGSSKSQVIGSAPDDLQAEAESKRNQ